ncbi:HlyD family secretion protein [Desulfovibrio litoralis]|uniref:Membrane fusion protein, multidrug efflux system n=1 Tax=Desulfovibrio litoralis DSM 11393 TaxID=1121455 RepID=A0A1M7RUZ2_9BACT|nr:efflux RND transporter periplasmic adaptor subunit [Desulfovibrio litoralis]SHN49918.1 membrane fusion protein, multidrug efflux system [Desulfovibrio litoralis DSM 11393]
MSIKSKVISIVMILGVIGFGYWFWLGGQELKTDNAVVEGDIIPIYAGISGYINKAELNNNDEVKAGDLLVSFDTTEYIMALTDENAKLAKMKQLSPNLGMSDAPTRNSSLQQLQHNEEVLKQELSHYSTLHAQAMIELSRVKNLVAQGSMSAEQLEIARNAENVIKSNLELVKFKMETASRARAAKDQEIQQTLSDLDSAYVRFTNQDYEAQVARVRKAEEELQRCYIKAPISGYIINKNVKVGKMAEKGQELLQIIPKNPKGLWINSTFSRTDAEKIKLNQYVEFSVSAYPNTVFSAYVASIEEKEMPIVENTGDVAKKLDSQVSVKFNLLNQEQMMQQPLQIGMQANPTIFLNKFVSLEQQRPGLFNQNSENRDNKPKEENKLPQQTTQELQNVSETKSPPQTLPQKVELPPMQPVAPSGEQAATGSSPGQIFQDQGYNSLYEKTAPQQNVEKPLNENKSNDKAEAVSISPNMINNGVIKSANPVQDPR